MKKHLIDGNTLTTSDEMDLMMDELGLSINQAIILGLNTAAALHKGFRKDDRDTVIPIASWYKAILDIKNRIP